jgi:hypothetical protein
MARRKAMRERKRALLRADVAAGKAISTATKLRDVLALKTRDAEGVVTVQLSQEMITKTAASFSRKKWNILADSASRGAVASEAFNIHDCGKVTLSEAQWRRAFDQMKFKCRCDYTGVATHALKLAFKAKPAVMTETFNLLLSVASSCRSSSY